MDQPVERQLSEAFLERLGPIISTVESQLRDLAQDQTTLQENVAQLSSELNMTQAELDKVHDTFARLPHYIAKLAAMKNTIVSATALSRKLQRRADQVAIGREKQAVKQQANRVKEQAYDQAVAAVRVAPSAPSQQQPSGKSSESISPTPPNTQIHDVPKTPTPSSMPASPSLLTVTSMKAATAAVAVLESATAKAVSMASRASSQSQQSQQSSSGLRLPFPLPAKPAFPVVSTMRPSSRSGSPSSSLSSGMSPLLSGKDSERDMTASPASATTSRSLDSGAGIDQSQEREDRFAQVSYGQDDASIAAVGSSEVEVVRLRRKKKSAPKSSASSISSISTNASTKKSQGTKTKSTKSTLGAQQAEQTDQKEIP
ncbi:hypothetical protein BGZ58_000861 [Dissophora ornata]|nr:hypothetical protein BGZ58_000861 [Dissophora ornata]